MINPEKNESFTNFMLRSYGFNPANKHRESNKGSTEAPAQVEKKEKPEPVEKIKTSEVTKNQRIVSAIRNMEGIMAIKLIDVEMRIRESNERLQSIDKLTEDSKIQLDEIYQLLDTNMQRITLPNDATAIDKNKEDLVPDTLEEYIKDHEFIPVKIINPNDIAGGAAGGVDLDVFDPKKLKKIGGALKTILGLAGTILTSPIALGIMGATAATAYAFSSVTPEEFNNSGVDVSNAMGDFDPGAAYGLDQNTATEVVPPKSQNQMMIEQLQQRGKDRSSEGATAPGRDRQGFDPISAGIAEQVGASSVSGGYVPSKSLTGRENAVVEMIGNREGSTNPDVIFGDTGNTPGTGKYSKALGLGSKKLTDMTINEVIELQSKLRDMTKADGIGKIGNKVVGTSAVGAGQFIEGTLKSNLLAMGIPESKWGSVKFDADLQKQLILQNFRSNVGDPNADPSTWNLTGLGNQWESFDTSKGFAGLKTSEIEAVRGASTMTPLNTTIAGSLGGAAGGVSNSLKSMGSAIGGLVGGLSKSTTMRNSVPAKNAPAAPAGGSGGGSGSKTPNFSTPGPANPLPAIDEMFIQYFKDSAII